MSWRWTLSVACLIILLGKPNAAIGQSAEDSTAVIRLNRVIIIGNKKTKDWIISRELSLKTGDSVVRYQLKTILKKDQNKIYNLRIFHTAQVRSLELPDKTFDLLVEVEERFFTFPVPIFELSDRNFNEWWENYNHKFNRVNYGLRLYQYNFRGRNETIRLTAQFGFSRKLDLIYRIPYIDKRQKQGLIFEANFSEPKNLAYQTTDHKLVFLSGRETLRKKYGFGVTYTYRKSFYETHAITAEYDNSTIADTIQLLIQENQPDPAPNYFLNSSRNQWYTALSYTFISEHRDVVAYPLNGYQVIAGLKRFGLGLGESVNMTTFFASLANHKSLKKGFYFSNFTSGYYATPGNQPYYLYYGLGYKKQFVRGYEIYVIEGPWYALNKTTLKKRIFKQVYRLDVLPWERFQHFPIAIYLKAYADVGYTRNYNYYEDRNQNTLLSNRLIAGVGLGLDLVTAYDGVLRIEYTLNREGAHGFFFHIKREF
jgi:outer membrane protein assembly factor BamA